MNIVKELTLDGIRFKRNYRISLYSTMDFFSIYDSDAQCLSHRKMESEPDEVRSLSHLAAKNLSSQNENKYIQRAAWKIYF